MYAAGDVAGTGSIVPTPPVGKAEEGGTGEGQRPQHPSGLSTLSKDGAAAMALAPGRTTTLWPPPLRVRLWDTHHPRDELAKPVRRTGLPIPKRIHLVTTPPSQLAHGDESTVLPLSTLS